MADQRLNVLFIDDEDWLLQALRRRLRSMRLEWNVEFVNNGSEALRHIEQKNIDVVISDIRMPGMSGTALLKTIQERHPEVVRIILSGYVENIQILEAVGASHQYLAKPCGAEKIVEAINRSIHLRSHIPSQCLLRRVTGITNIPILPDAFERFMKELSEATASINSIADVIEHNFAIAAIIMKLTNSEYLGLPNKMISIKNAVQYLGIETIQSLVKVTGVFDLMDYKRDIALQIRTINRESMAIASLARQIALSENLGKDEAEIAFCAGLFSQLGSVLFLMDKSSKSRGYLQKLKSEPLVIPETEKMLFGTTHAYVGAYLLSLWGFTDSIIEAVLYQHDPSKANVKIFNATTSVYIARELICHLWAVNNVEIERQNRVQLNAPYLRELGKLDRVAVWEGLCNEQYNCRVVQ
ncbi:MAG: Nitrogen regulation protein NR(I) [Alphaproteobacteria bacterium MarineAlpha3_Bin5]|nr:MAG: Nitrogen regulation protein NR(I) [Alphaproteobacteria bacterium MarineAlpha3_Bin5]